MALGRGNRGRRVSDTAPSLRGTCLGAKCGLCDSRLADPEQSGKPHLMFTIILFSQRFRKLELFQNKKMYVCRGWAENEVKTGA